MLFKIMAQKLPVVLNKEERLALLEQPNMRYISGHRNHMIMVLMLNAGLRLSEVINLKWVDVDFLDENIMVREGKGKKDRILFVQNNNWRDENFRYMLEIWQGRAKEYFAGELPVHVFTTISKNNSGNPLSPRYIQQMIGRYAEKAGIKKHVTPHTLRHTFATDLYRKIKDIVNVQNALGHSNISTTMIYVHLASSDLRIAMSGG